jgi:hypothetical protein
VECGGVWGSGAAAGLTRGRPLRGAHCRRREGHAARARTRVLSTVRASAGGARSLGPPRTRSRALRVSSRGQRVARPGEARP